ncbi:hypothetical protein RchiOBHm_Chr5g0014531 [Rosa chinensis]|uniref:Uncharacterized protein n=1 Tax=Rosa chinensis TaxID=74649 RepID=A0A2P6Q5P6_ROSCH|nr:hypothetical protein RchiOBHm_Chr5g0014531 [Rosa chinensis]
MQWYQGSQNRPCLIDRARRLADLQPLRRSWAVLGGWAVLAGRRLGGLKMIFFLSLVKGLRLRLKRNRRNMVPNSQIVKLLQPSKQNPNLPPVAIAIATPSVHRHRLSPSLQ